METIIRPPRQGRQWPWPQGLPDMLGSLLLVVRRKLEAEDAAGAEVRGKAGAG
jgi:hypothetical protein